MDVDSFRFLVEDALEQYSDSVPFSRVYESINLQNARRITLDENFDEELKRKPDYLSEVHPIRSQGSVYGYFANVHYGRGYSSNYQSVELSDPTHAPWDYNHETGLLVVSYSAFYKVRAVYRHLLEEIEDTNTGDFTYCIKTMSLRDQAFIKLLQGKFLLGLGKSRRAFTLNDLPILMDASEIVSEGKEMVEEAENEIQEKYKKIRLSYGG